MQLWGAQSIQYNDSVVDNPPARPRPARFDLFSPSILLAGLGVQKAAYLHEFAAQLFWRSPDSNMAWHGRIHCHRQASVAKIAVASHSLDRCLCRLLVTGWL